MDPKDISKRKILSYEQFKKDMDTFQKSGDENRTEMQKDLAKAHPGYHKIEAEPLFTKHDSNYYKASGIEVDKKFDNSNDYIKPGLTKPQVNTDKEQEAAEGYLRTAGADTNANGGITEAEKTFEGNISTYENFLKENEEEEAEENDEEGEEKIEEDNGNGDEEDPEDEKYREEQEEEEGAFNREAGYESSESEEIDEARSIGKANIKKLNQIILDNWNKNNDVTEDEIIDQLPSEWWDIWEAADSEIRRIIYDQLTSLTHTGKIKESEIEEAKKRSIKEIDRDIDSVKQELENTPEGDDERLAELHRQLDGLEAEHRAAHGIKEDDAEGEEVENPETDEAKKPMTASLKKSFAKAPVKKGFKKHFSQGNKPKLNPKAGVMGKSIK